MLVAALCIAISFLWSVGQDFYWRSNPTSAFRAITGRDLPPGVTATAYNHEMTDNLFHTTHYWLLAGSPSALRKVTEGTGFVESPDALHMVPSLTLLFGSATAHPKVAVGYEWELDHDRWYCIFEGEATACYAH